MSDLEPILALIHQTWHGPPQLDEIDARATAFVQGLPYDRHDHAPDTGRLRVWMGMDEPAPCLQLATSRDALKRFAPPNWWLHEVAPCVFMGDRRPPAGEPDAWVWSKMCATPELAELHCLLQAYQYERDRLADTGQWRPPEVRLACLVRFDHHEARMLDLVATGAGVPSQVMAQRLVTEALFRPEMGRAATRPV